MSRARALAPRVLLTLAAVAAIAWLALGYRQERRLADVASVGADQAAGPGEIEAALERLADSDWRIPHGSRAESVRAALHVRQGRFDLAADAYERVVEDEPENAEAWFLLARFSQQARDPERQAEALDRLDRLDPVNAQARRRLFR